MKSDRNYAPHSSHTTNILTMTRAPLAIEFETVSFDDFDKFQKCAFQAGHAMGNSTVAESWQRVLPEIVNLNNRQAHIKRSKNGAFRASSRDRSGSGSASAVS